MAEIDKDKLRKLSIADRIKKLKEMEEEKSKEIEEARKLLKETEAEAERERVASSVEVPEQEEVDISRLFAPEGSELEQEAAKKKLTEEEVAQVEYQINKDYKALKEMTGGPLDTYNIQRLEEIEERLSTIDYKQVSSEVADQLVASRGVLKNIRKYGGL